MQAEGVGERPVEDAAQAEVDRADERADQQRARQEGDRTGQPERRARVHYVRATLSALAIARTKFTTRGPQRDAIESSMRTIAWLRTAEIVFQPGRDDDRLPASARSSARPRARSGTGSRR